MRLTCRIRIATLGEQGDAHECTPVLSVGVPGATAQPSLAGRSYAKGPVARWTVVHRATGRGERA
ncbi:hypothetical protein T261_03025 [Streptomyces lydicus]|nr:hypothetical protein T261_03025 [Streptomyces lydicus]